MKLLICQIPLHLGTKPFHIVNLDEHINTKQKCIEYALSNSAEVVIFPEYCYSTKEYDYLLEKSKTITIFAGSYQDANNFNQATLFSNGCYAEYAKINLSPYETVFPSQYSIRSSSNTELGYFEIMGKTCYILTCFDYYRLASQVWGKPLADGRLIDLFVSSCCNDKPEPFLKIAEATHLQRDTLTSIICNVSELTIDNKSNKYGSSAIFGLYDKNSMNNIQVNGWSDPQYVNMITKFPDGAQICEVTLQIPYNSHRMGAFEFTPNPIDINYIPLASLLA